MPWRCTDSNLTQILDNDRRRHDLPGVTIHEGIRMTISVKTFLHRMRIVIGVALVHCFVAAQSATAGMPSISLTDAGRTRFSTLSFFLMMWLLSAWGVRLFWNLLRRDFPQMAALSYKGAVAGVFLWGMMFVVVLTMISGTRELMTPGAWEKQGSTYQLATTNTNAEAIAAEVSRQLSLHSERRSRLQHLGETLNQIARETGSFPNINGFRELPDEIRSVPGQIPADYIYRKPQGDDLVSIVLLEPNVFPDGLQLAWYRSGLIGEVHSNTATTNNALGEYP